MALFGNVLYSLTWLMTKIIMTMKIVRPESSLRQLLYLDSGFTYSLLLFMFLEVVERELLTLGVNEMACNDIVTLIFKLQCSKT